MKRKPIFYQNFFWNLVLSLIYLSNFFCKTILQRFIDFLRVSHLSFLNFENNVYKYVGMC